MTPDSVFRDRHSRPGINSWTRVGTHHIQTASIGQYIDHGYLRIFLAALPILAKLAAVGRFPVI